MTEGRMSAELLQPSGPKTETKRSVVRLIFRWLTQISGAVARPIYPFLRLIEPAPCVTAEQRADGTTERAAVAVTATEKRVIKPTTTKTVTDPFTSDNELDSDAQIVPIAQTVPDERETQRRRDLVRTLFNDFWNGSCDKPAAIADRLDQAENYLNERLIACGEFWQLDTKTRVLLGLPPRSNSFNKGNAG
jgi:hypothetical protein